MRHIQTVGWPVISACNSTWRLAHGRSLNLGATGYIMAIINVTPDSFSDGGRHHGVDAAVRHALDCVDEGASILDIGGESTRPGATEVSPAEEQDRVLPVIERLRLETDALISIDTYRAETAKLALAAGAHIVNDVHGLQGELDMASVVAEARAGLCIMHTGRGREGQKHVDPVEDQKSFLAESLQLAASGGIGKDAIVLDPGFGFAKGRNEDAELMARLPELLDMGHPLLVGTSRKRFVGAITGREAPSDRDVGTSATTAILRLAGASIFRVHNVAANLDALKMADAILSAAGRKPERDVC